MTRSNDTGANALQQRPRRGHPDGPSDWAMEPLLAVIENIAAGVIMCDAEGTLTLFSDTTQRIHGLPADPLPPERWAEHYGLYYPDGRTRMRTEDIPLYRALQGEHVRHEELVIKPADGPPRRVLNSGRAIFDRTGRKLGAVIVVEDITARQQMEDSLRQSEARYRLVASSLSGIDLYLFDHDLRFLLADGAEMRRHGLCPEKMQGRHLRDVVDDATASIIEPAYRSALEGQEATVEVEFGGESYSVRTIPVRDTDGTVASGVALVQNITAHRRAERLNRFQNQILEDIARAAPLHHVLTEIVHMIEANTPGACASVLVLDDDHRLRVRAAPNLPKDYIDAIDGIVPGPLAGSCGDSAYHREAVVVDDISTDDRWQGVCDVAVSAGLKACWCRPIQGPDGNVLGTLALYYSDTGVPLDRDAPIAANAIRLAGIAVERWRREQDLHRAQQRIAYHVENTPLAVIEWDSDFRVRRWSKRAEELFGWRADEVMGLTPVEWRFVCESDVQAVSDNINALLSGREVRNVAYNGNYTKDGNLVCCEWYNSVLLDNGGRMISVMSLVQDVSERKAAENALSREKELAQVTLESIGDGVVRTDARGNIAYLNPVAEQLTGWPMDEAVDRRIGDVFYIISERTRRRLPDMVEQCISRCQAMNSTARAVLVSRDGTEYAVDKSVAPVRDRSGDVVGAVLVFRDVSEQRRMHRDLSYYASHDSLTGLLNRREFESRLQALLEQSHRLGSRHALLYMDLDQFKVINDTCGHPAGDQMLVRLAAVLKSRVASGHTLARLGGDEFGILLNACDLDEAYRLAEGLVTAVQEFRFVWEGKLFTVGASVGVVAIDDQAQDMATLLSASDAACYAAKDKGRNRVQVYYADDQELARRHDEMAWVYHINRALEEERFMLYRQSFLPLNSRARPMYEVLIRMLDDNGDLMGPQGFISAAERYNLMPSIDRWVVRHTFERIGRHECGSAEDAFYAINLSGVTLSDEGFIAFVRQQFEKYGVSPASIGFEITETAAIANIERAVLFINAMRDLGCTILLDDFGSGTSSFAYLKTLHVDYLKIDGLFVRDMVKDSVNNTMVEAIHRMSTALGIDTVAECVEDEETLECLRHIGVGYAQGYAIHAPEPWLAAAQELPSPHAASSR